ncbi:hypothetical protein Vi05172_g11656 [Venturia inaequalis]|nr:hypothetical protein Vi05172_g11656 [Venturia inaequalis]
MISQPGPKFERKILLMQMGGLLPATVEGDQEFRQGKYALLGTFSIQLQTGISPSKITFPLVDDDGECTFSDRLYSSRDFLTTMFWQISMDSTMASPAEAQQAVLERDEIMNVLNMRRSQMTTKVARLAHSHIAIDFGHLFDKLQSQRSKPRFK